MQRLWVLALLAAVPPGAAAHESRAVMVVTAQVAPRVSLETLSEPGALVISADDLARGYVDVSAAYRVRNNDPRGYSLRLEPRVGLASEVAVSGLAADVVMREELVEVTQPAALEARDLKLRFRLTLGTGAVEGVHPMPLRVSVATL